MLADELDYMVGVDTHRDRHTLAVVAAPSGGVIGQRSVRANARGYVEAVRFAEKHAPGARLWAVEGAGHYGAGLARHLSRHGEFVVESGRGSRDERRLRGKDDPARRDSRCSRSTRERDARRTEGGPAARGVEALAGRAARSDRRAPAGARAAAQRDRDPPDRLRGELETLPERRLLERCGHFRRSGACPVDELATKLVLRTLARRIEVATAEADQLEREILGHVRALAPQLLNERGVGPIVAADVIVAWSHPGRVRSEAAFARLAGVAPVPASSGQTIRHRLSRGGDRQLNRALHTIILQRRQHDPRRRPTSSDASPRARAAAKRPACSSATSPATFTDYCSNSR
jgi:transposase